MKIISIRQPWAWLIVHGGKNIENRTWKTNYRGPVLIHASTKWAASGAPELPYETRNALRFGGVIGVVELVDCVTSHPGEWFAGPYGLVLCNPREVEFIEWGGTLGLRRAPLALVERIVERPAREHISQKGTCVKTEVLIQ